MNFWKFWLLGAVASYPILVPALRDIFRKRMASIEQQISAKVIPYLDEWAKRHGRSDAVEIYGSPENLNTMLERQLNVAVLLVSLLVSTIWFISLPLVLLMKRMH